MMSVLRNHRKKGIAKALLAQCIESAKHHGLSEIVAFTEPDCVDAVSFDLGSAFKQYGSDDIDIHLRLLLAGK